MIERIRRLIAGGELPTVEFKTAKRELNRDLYETVCGMLNREGGDILLGVADDGSVRGVDPDAIDRMKRDFATTINNPKKLSPSPFLSLTEVEVEGVTILHLQVPPSSQVHRVAGRIFDRNEDGDFDITDNQTLVAALYRRKDAAYTENTTYPEAELADLQPRLIELVRKRARAWQADHPWAGLDDEELLKSARLFRRDPDTGKEALTLAALLLFGTDDVTLDALPAYRIDALLRRVDTVRYDDRDLIITNLLDSYDRLMAFGRKHLPDPFYLEGIERVSIRDEILREIVSNMLIHREYTDGTPGRLIIEADRLVAENANKPHHFGRLDLSNYEPYPKNPVIARVFREIHYADELGSGVRRLFPAAVRFGGSEPELLEDRVFRATVRLPDLGLSGKTSEKMSEKMSEKTSDKILQRMRTEPQVTIADLATALQLSTRTIERNIQALQEQGRVRRVGPDKGGHWEVLE